MENPEEVLQLLERFTKLKQKDIPRELEDYLRFVARTGDTVYRWPIVKQLFREKLLHVITDFYDSTPSISDLPQYPNVDPFNYECMRRTLVDRLDHFSSAPFTVQRICELLTEPRKQYTRIDKFMRAIEKNILVVSTQEPGRRRSDSENGDSLDSIVNGDLEVNVDIEMDNEAFAVESSELAAQNSATPSASSSAASTPSTSSTPPVVDASTSAATEAPEASTPTEPSLAEKDSESTPGSATPSAAAVDESDSVEVSSNRCSDDQPLTSTEEQPETLKPSEESTIPEEKDEFVPCSTEECTDAVDSAIVSEVPSMEKADEPKTEITEPVETKSEPPVELPVTADQHDEAVDDGQPKAKLVKLDEFVPNQETADTKQDIVSQASAESIESEKEELSSASTTDSGGSSTSVDSESVSSGTDNSASNSAETLDSVVIINPEEIIDPLQVEETKETVESSVALKQVPTQPAESIPIEIVPSAEQPALVTENESLVVSSTESALIEEAEPKAIEVEIAEPNPIADEMETGSSNPVPESVMATDEEESASDSVVPMAAEAITDVPKVEDNAMDIDESSVEPMDQ